tara:strand:+ start:4766 stop:5047 length:282 start_codon:yes stop_codon:yes gene_type:complete
MISSEYLGKLVIIKWIDAKEIESGWHDRSDIIQTVAPEILSVGWLAERTNHEIKISADIPTDPEDKESGRSQVIPLGCIKEFNEINCGYVWSL